MNDEQGGNEQGAERSSRAESLWSVEMLPDPLAGTLVLESVAKDFHIGSRRSSSENRKGGETIIGRRRVSTGTLVDSKLSTRPANTELMAGLLASGDSGELLEDGPIGKSCALSSKTDRRRSAWSLFSDASESDNEQGSRSSSPDPIIIGQSGSGNQTVELKTDQGDGARTQNGIIKTRQGTADISTREYVFEEEQESVQGEAGDDVCHRVDHKERYARFVESINKVDAIDLLRRMKLFAVSCRLESSEREREGGHAEAVNFSSLYSHSRPSRQQDAVLSERDYSIKLQSRISEFLKEMDSIIYNHHLYSDASESQLHDVREGVEKFIMCKVYDCVFASDPDEVKRCLDLEERMLRLATIITPDHLDVPASCRNEMVLSLVQEELRNINSQVAPIDKVDCIVEACSIIFNTLNRSFKADNSLTLKGPRRMATSSAKGYGADDFVPAFFYCTLRANAPQLWSNVKYIRKFRNSDSMVSHQGYCFATLCSALEFYANADASSFKGLSQQEWDAAMGPSS